jgi:F-type H+-transporting ATPase subunit b
MFHVPSALRRAPVWLAILLVLTLAAGSSTPAGLAARAIPQTGQPGHATAAAAPEHGAAPEEAASHEGGSPWAMVARLFNFAVLAGTLVYFLRSPFMAFLATRRTEIRASLVKAAEVSRKSAEQVAHLDQRLAALPAEIDALRARGAADIAAEEAKIRGMAQADRARLIEQARRQVDLQLRVARRQLVGEAADRAVALASDRIRRSIRDDDQRRLLEAYLARVAAVPSNAAPGASDAAGGQP